MIKACRDFKVHFLLLIVIGWLWWKIRKNYIKFQINFFFLHRFELAKPRSKITASRLCYFQLIKRSVKQLLEDGFAVNIYWKEKYVTFYLICLVSNCFTHFIHFTLLIFQKCDRNELKLCKVQNATYKVQHTKCYRLLCECCNLER